MTSFSPQISAPDEFESGICRFLASHPCSSALAVAQHVWQAGQPPRDVHIDSWLWIRDQMEKLAERGILRRQQRQDAWLWSLGEAAPVLA